jgi:hypothetical protein
LTAAFRRQGAGFVLREEAVSDRALVAAARVIRKLRRNAGLAVPEPPGPPDWRVWQLRQAGWKYEALAAHDSPVKRDLRGKSPESRKVLAIRAVRRIEEFRRAAPPWWFRVLERFQW